MQDVKVMNAPRAVPTIKLFTSQAGLYIWRQTQISAFCFLAFVKSGLAVALGDS